jgi:hypothetical protein
MTQMTGGCACGAKRFTAEVGDEQAYLCHCRMCQRASGNVSLAMVVLPTKTIRWDGEPDWYRSSAIAERPFCARCGTSLGFRYLDTPEKMDLTVASFDDPSRFTPHTHFGAESMWRAWINTEGLPEIRSEEHAALQARWEKSGTTAD